MTELRNAITLKARPGITDPGPRFHFIQDLAALFGAGLPTLPGDSVRPGFPDPARMLHALGAGL
jgi:hypothetical protein